MRCDIYFTILYTVPTTGKYRSQHDCHIAAQHFPLFTNCSLPEVVEKIIVTYKYLKNLLFIIKPTSNRKCNYIESMQVFKAALIK